MKRRIGRLLSGNTQWAQLPGGSRGVSFVQDPGEGMICPPPRLGRVTRSTPSSVRLLQPSFQRPTPTGGDGGWRSCCRAGISTHHSAAAKSTSPQGTRISSSSFHEDDDDLYQMYRSKTPSPTMVAELQLETIQTRQRIHSETLARVQDQIYEAWSRGVQHHPPLPEYGPTGTWRYGMAVQTANNSDHGGDDEVASRTTKRRYQRTWWHDDGHGLDEIEQSIFELEPTDTVLSMSLSVDESCLACLVEDTTTGQRQVRLHHIESNRQVSLDMGERIVCVEWGGASSALGGGIHALYFVETDEQGRPDRVLRSHVHSTVLHMIDEPQLLIRSYDPSEMVVAQRTKGCEFISIQIMTKTSNEIYLSSAGQSSLQLVMQRQPNVQYHLDIGEHGDIVMLLSDHGRDYVLLEASTKSLPLDPEETLRKVRTASPEKQAVITDMDLFRNYLVLYETSTTTGYPQIRIQDRESRKSSHSTTIPLEPKVVQVCPTGNVFFGATSLRLIIENPCTPPTTYELDFSSLDLKPVNGSTSLESSRNVKQERVFVPSSDGTSIPMSLFYQDDGGDPAMISGEGEKEEALPWWSFLGSTGGETSNKQESRPVLLMGYGSYGEPVNFGYDPALKPLLEQGYVLAFGHSRGGGELGRTWYHAGRLHSKPNAINDFLACAEHLHNRFQSKVSVRGFSAAGVVLGAAVNQRPGLFESLVLTNPFLDLYATMVNPSLYLTAHEWDEFGNPQDDEEIDRLIRSYCPIRNVASNTDSYPRCLLIGTLDDENVPWWNPTIFAKKVRDGMSDKDNVLLHIEERGGHHLGPKRLEVSALEVAFLLNGVTHKKCS